MGSATVDCEETCICVCGVPGCELECFCVCGVPGMSRNVSVYAECQAVIGNGRISMQIFS